jgi:hypothetical protein
LENGGKIEMEPFNLNRGAITPQKPCNKSQIINKIRPFYIYFF